MLRTTGIPHIPLKGIDCLLNLYQSKALRPMDDIDLLVHLSDAGPAESALLSLGYARITGPNAVHPSPYLNSRLYRSNAPSGPAIHLHWDLVNGSIPIASPRAAADLQRSWARSTESPLGFLFDPADRFVYLCAHALKHSFSVWAHWMDLGLALFGGPEAVPGRGLDPVRVVEAARAGGQERAVGLAATLLRDLFDLPVPAALTDLRPRPTPLAERLFESLVRGGRQREGMCALVYWGDRPDWAARLRFLRGVLAPPREDLGTIDRADGARAGWPDYLRRAGSALALAGRWLT